MSQRKNRKERTKMHIDLDSAPDYSVEEDQHGNMVNRDKLLIWPSRKPLRRCDFEAITGKAVEGDDYSVLTDFNDDNDQIFDTSDDSEVQQKHTPDVDDELYIGASFADEAERRIGPAAFVLYYKIPRPEEVGTKTSLFMAYRNNVGLVSHFPLLKRAVAPSREMEERSYWRVGYADNAGREFTSLSALIKYYKIFCYYDPNSGRIEAFPLWMKKMVDE